jgi:calcium-dependent protein kinase
MSGYLPFQAANSKEIENNIATANVFYGHKEFENCSDEVMNLLKSLLVLDPKKRLSASEAL